MAVSFVLVFLGLNSWRDHQFWLCAVCRNHTTQCTPRLATHPFSFKLKVESVICLNRSGPIRIFLFNVIIDTTRLKPKINLQASLAQQSQSTTYHHESGPHCPVCVVFCPTLTARTLTGNSVDSELLTAATLRHRSLCCLCCLCFPTQRQKNKTLHEHSVQYTPNVMREPDNTHH